MKISEAGFIGRDGKLRLPMERLEAYFAQHSNERVVATFEVEERGSTAAQQAYYYNYIIPQMVEAKKRTGERISEGRMDMELIEAYPGEKRREGYDIVIARQFSKNQMSDYLDWLQQYAAEMDIYIEDPSTL